MFLLNGKPTDSVTLSDRGLHYGDGLFETIAVIDGVPLCWEKHLNRILLGCKRLNILFNHIDALETEVAILCKTLEHSILKIIITSGVSNRGYKRPIKIEPTRLLATYPWPKYLTKSMYSHGINVCLCSTRLGNNFTLAGIKHLNRLEQVLAHNEFEGTDTIEGIMRDQNNHVISGTMSNLFLVYENKKLLTPEISSCGVAGVIRQCILEQCESFGYTSKLLQLSLEDIYAAKEIFFCNSILGILPVAKLEKHVFSAPFVSLKIRDFLIEKRIIAKS